MEISHEVGAQSPGPGSGFHARGPRGPWDHHQGRCVAEQGHGPDAPGGPGFTRFHRVLCWPTNSPATSTAALPPRVGGVPTAPPPEGTGPAPTSQREGPAVAPGPRPVGRAHGRAHSYRPQAICVGPRAPVTVQHGGGGPMPRSEGSLPCPARAPRGPSGTASEHSSPPAVRTTDHAAQAHAPLDARWSRSQRKWTVTARDRTVAQGQREHVGRRGRSRLCLTDSSAPAIRLLGPGLPPAGARTAMGICRPLGWGLQGLSTRARWAGMAEEHRRPDPGPPGPLRCPGPGG